MLFWRLCAVGFLLIGAILLTQRVRAAEPVIYFHTAPGSQLLRPYSEPATLSILVTEPDGLPVREGAIEIELDGPEQSRWFSTDYPWAEGSRLIQMRLPLIRGKAAWRYSFPIRGDYRLKVVYQAADNARSSRIFTFNVREHRAKWFFLGAFTSALFAVGFVAARIFSQGSRVGSGVSLGTGLVAACLLFAGTAASGSREDGASPGSDLEIGPARVGRPASLHWSLENSEPGPRRALTLTIAHVEKGTIVFAVEKLPVEREFGMEFHFTDAAEYRVMAVSEAPAQPATRREQLVNVAASEPPGSAAIPALTLFMGALIAGLAAGRLSRGRLPRSRRLRR